MHNSKFDKGLGIKMEECEKVGIEVERVQNVVIKEDPENLWIKVVCGGFFLISET